MKQNIGGGAVISCPLVSYKASSSAQLSHFSAAELVWCDQCSNEISSEIKHTIVFFIHALLRFCTEVAFSESSTLVQYDQVLLIYLCIFMQFSAKSRLAHPPWELPPPPPPKRKSWARHCFVNTFKGLYELSCKSPGARFFSPPHLFQQKRY